MKIKLTATAAFLLVLLSALMETALFAQDTSDQRTITVEEAVTLAMENNIQLASTAIDVRVKKREAENAWNVFIPNVMASGTMARTNMTEMTVQTGNPMMPTATIDLEEKDRWTAMGNLSISLNLNAALFEGLKMTRQNFEAGKISLVQAQAQTEKNVRKAFYGILLQEGSLKLAKEKFATSEERVKQTKINFSNGLVPELSYLQTQLSVEMQKPTIMDSELNLDQQKNSFAFLLGLPVGTQITLEGAIEPTISSYNVDELIEKNMGNRLDLALIQKNIELMNTQIRATTLQRYTPSLSLSQTFMPRLSAIDDTWTDVDNWTDSSGSFSLTLSFNLTNLLPFSASGQSLETTRENVRKLELNMNQAAYNAELEIRNLVRKLDKSRTSIAAMGLSVSIAEKAYRLSEQGYRAGTIEYLDLKDAENSLLQAKLGELSEKFNYASTILDLESALNTKLY